jgi:hypothetical protein
VLAAVAMTAMGAHAADQDLPEPKVKDVVVQCADTVKPDDRERAGCSIALLSARMDAAMKGDAVLCEPGDVEVERSELVKWLASRADLQESDGVAGLRMGMGALYRCR